jgi:hypothetical protein
MNSQSMLSAKHLSSKILDFPAISTKVSNLSTFTSPKLLPYRITEGSEMSEKPLQNPRDWEGQLLSDEWLNNALTKITSPRDTILARLPSHESKTGEIATIPS